MEAETFMPRLFASNSGQLFYLPFRPILYSSYRGKCSIVPFFRNFELKTSTRFA